MLIIDFNFVNIALDLDKVKLAINDREAILFVGGKIK